MGHQTTSYRVGLARPDEVPRLRAFEDAAGRSFSGLGLIEEALDVSFPLDDLARLVAMGQVWVGYLEDGLPVARRSDRWPIGGVAATYRASRPT
jgi:hypothetical protein